MNKKVSAGINKITGSPGHRRTEKKFPVVGVGASAGGLSAFKEFFKKMPANTGMAFVLIQHLDPTHESLMVDLLSSHTKMEVIQAGDDMEVQPNRIYMIPPNSYLAINNNRLKLHAPEQRRGLRTPIDFFFNSLAEDQRENAICIILSGTGTDGTSGLKAVKDNGGIVIVQLPEEAQYDGMPSSAVATGFADFILPAGDIYEVLIGCTKHYCTNGLSEINSIDDFNNILAIMNVQLGYNFHYYKKNMLIRRIKRRMGLRQLEHMKDYVSILQNNIGETKELYKDCLIGVTGFFREPESWQALEELVLGSLLKSGKNQGLRIWIPGCSSGEEAYTLSILLKEVYSSLKIEPAFNIFATDIDTGALEFARRGKYPENIRAVVSENLLNKYFIKENEFYQASDMLRENLVFSVQNIITDPPFSKLDLISCRNLLIYLEPRIQQKVIELFHFSLNENGYLMLGNSETIGQNSHLFEIISKKWRIYKRIESSTSKRGTFPILTDKREWNRILQLAGDDTSRPIRKPGDIAKETLLEKYAPASLLITKSFEILYHFGDTGRYLRFPSGEQTSNLFSLVREGLTTRLKSALKKAGISREPVSVTGARVKREGKYYSVVFSVTPLDNFQGYEPLFLVSFHEDNQSPEPETGLNAEDETVIRQLEYELRSTREELQNTIMELADSNEAFKAGNEEIMSMNEEFQSSNEELETSKEELQSLNEELYTVNSELQEKIRQLEETNNDVTNLVNSTNIAVIFLDTRFQIKYYTPPASNLFNLIPTDIGRPLIHIRMRFEDPDLMKDAQTVIDSLKQSSAFVLTEDEEWYNRKIIPYRTQDGRVDGIVLTFENITELIDSKDALARQNQSYADAQSIARFGNWEFDFNADEITWSKEIYKIFELDSADFKITYDIFLNAVYDEDRETVKKAYRESHDIKSHYNIEYRIRTKGHKIKYINQICRTEYDRNNVPVKSVGTIQDISKRRIAEEALRENQALLQTIVDHSPVLVYMMDTEGRILLLNRKLERVFGIEREKYIGRTRASIMPEEIANAHRKNDLEVIRTRKPQEFIEENIEDNGRTCYYLTTKFPIFNKNKEVMAVCGISMDITERKRSEMIIRESEERFHQLFNNMDMGMAVYEAVEDGNNFIIKSINPAGERISSTRKEDILGRLITEVFPGVENFGLLPVLKRVWKTGTRQQHPVSIYKDNKISRWYENLVYRLTSGEVVAIFSDVTPQKEYEEKLKQSEYEKDTILNMVSDNIIYLNPDKTIRWMNNAAIELTGKDTEEMIGKKCHDLWGLDNQNCRDCPFSHALKSVTTVTGKLTDASGRNWMVKANPMLDPNGNLIGIIEIRNIIH